RRDKRLVSTSLRHIAVQSLSETIADKIASDGADRTADHRTRHRVARSRANDCSGPYPENASPVNEFIIKGGSVSRPDAQRYREPDDAKARAFHCSLLPLRLNGEKCSSSFRASRGHSPGSSLVRVLLSHLPLEPVDVAPLPPDLPALPIDLALLVGQPVFLSLELVSDQTTSQGAHSPTDGRAGPGVAYRTADDRATGRTYPASQQCPLFSSAQRARTPA